jgi:hypothetical protein
MSLGGAHFEVFSRRGSGAPWAFFGAYPGRDEAVNAAKEVLADGHARAVRVYRETFNEDTGEFLSQKVFEEGGAGGKSAKESIHLPCAKPDDLYTANGKRTIARLLRDALAGWRITATELLHHPGHVQRLELAGTVLQQGIQKWAVKHAGNTGQPVQQIIIKLNELVSEATRRVILDGQQHRFPSIEKEGFAPLLARLVNSATPDYLVNGALARHIAHARSWAEKLDYLLALMAELPKDEASRAFGAKAIDGIATEMLSGSAALVDLLGEQPDLGSALLHLTALFLGRAEEIRDLSPSLATLARAFADGQLPQARAAIGERIMREIRGVRRFKSGSLDDEILVMRKLAAGLVTVQGVLLSPDDFEDAFAARSSHLVQPETIERYLAGLERPSERIEKLLGLACNVVGDANKRELVFFINGILGSPRTETSYVDGREPVQARLSELRGIQEHIKNASFHKSHRIRMTEALDGLAVAAERKAGFLNGLAKSNPAPAALAEQLLLLLSSQGVTDGALAENVRARLRESMANPGFGSSLALFEESRSERFFRMLAAAGMEGSLKRKAAR